VANADCRIAITAFGARMFTYVMFVMLVVLLMYVVL